MRTPENIYPQAHALGYLDLKSMALDDGVKMKWYTACSVFE